MRILFVGHVGRFNKQKNHTFLIDIFNEAYKENDKLRLVMVGIGPLMNKIKKKVIQLNLSDAVLFLGQRSDVNELMQAMDIFILPSLYEGLPLVGVEAQTSGLPCLFSDTITKEVKLNTTTKYLSLKDDYSVWKENILNFKAFQNRYEVFSKKI